MTLPNASPLQSQPCPVPPQHGTVSTSRNADPGPCTVALSSVDESVLVTQSLVFKLSLKLVQSSIPNQDSRSPILQIDPNKPLPTPPCRLHSVHHSLMTLWYHRLKQLEGYRFGILCCVVLSGVVLVVNVTTTIWAVSNFRVQNGLGILQDGSCKRTRTLSTWIHLLINILSTLLQGASNYSMQCLSSPTRSEIDKAHNHGIWLDIGVPSVRNLRRLSMTRIILWWLLAVSSLPLHLLYNSAVFSSLCTRQFNVFVVSNEFLDGAPFELPDLPLKRTLQGYQKNQTSLAKLENTACVDIYTAQPISKNSDLLMVSTYSNSINSLYDYVVNATSKMHATNNKVAKGGNLFCSDDLAGGGCKSKYDFDPRNWTIGTFPDSSLVSTDSGSRIQYCLSDPVDEHCKLQFSLAIMIAVIVCNLVKTICISVIAWKPNWEPLVTLGDAIASFLDRPDVTTKGNCIVGKARFEDSRRWDSLSSTWDPSELKLRRFRAASSRRWLACNFL